MSDRTTALWREAYEEGITIEMIQEILQIDPAQVGVSCYHSTLLHMAAGSGCHEGIKLLAGYGASVNAIDDSGQTPLHLAAWNLDHECCRQLIDAGADPTVRDFLGRTPFEVAINGSIQEYEEDSKITQRILAPAEGKKALCSEVQADERI